MLMLTEDDKQWIREQLQLLATRDQLETTRHQLEATRHQIEATRDQLEATHHQLEATRDQVEATRHQLEAIRDQIEAVETRLLTEFHKWASPAEARARTHTAALRAVELEQLQDRVQKLEQNPPSPPQ